MMCLEDTWFLLLQSLRGLELLRLRRKLCSLFVGGLRREIWGLAFFLEEIGSKIIPHCSWTQCTKPAWGGGGKAIWRA